MAGAPAAGRVARPLPGCSGMRLRRRCAWLAGPALALGLLAAAPPPAMAQPPKREPWLREASPALAGWLDTLPALARDSQVDLRLRSFYYNRQNANGTANEAWALGGWLEYRSGWLAEAFSVGAVGYASLPAYAPEERGGTRLLTPGQDEILVLGQAYGRLRWEDYALLTGYRQLVDDGYLNPQDTRMIPNTFEGATLRGTLGPLAYHAGYLTQVKPRDSRDFESMAQAAGVRGEDRGLALGSFTLTPLRGLVLHAATNFGVDVFNTAFARAEYTQRLAEEVRLALGVQYTDQRSVGEALLGEFSTYSVGTLAGIWWRGLDVSVRFHATGDGATIRTPYGKWPGYLSLFERDFDRAREKAWGVRSQYDLRRLGLRGLGAVLFFARGVDARDPRTGAPLPDRNEGDLELTYDVPWARGLQFRFRNASISEGGPQVTKNFQIIINYLIPVL